MPESSVSQLEADLTRTMLVDRHRLRQQLRTLKQQANSGQPHDRNLQRLAEQIGRSVQLRQEQLARRPAAVAYDDELPISARREEIAAAIRDHQVVIVCGETGSGKSTQLPKICVEMGRGIDGTIGHTQPRRIAARSVAARVAQELATPLGGLVGCKVRFSDETGPHTLIKLMTDGMLLAESQKDRYFNQYDTLIIDEAHERSLNIDFLLGCIKRILPKRPELRLIITSATIDAARFSEHFSSAHGPAPVVEVSGRTYPVDVRYRPPTDKDDDPDLPDLILSGLEEISREEPGDVLIFLPTEYAIHETAKRLRSRPLPGDRGQTTEILPLYARLSAKEQQRVFDSHSQRRIVLATNVAESSLTVPGIRAVIDTGTARISRYSARSKVQRLPIEAISQASANQRAGRCGRIGPGICVRLYAEDDFSGREAYTQPEIQRTNLAAVILQAKALNLGEIEDFPFLDPPRPEAIRDGYKTLFELGALTRAGIPRAPQNTESDAPSDPAAAVQTRSEAPMGAAAVLTPLGRQLARLPVDPRIGRMILAACDERCLTEMLIIASALEVQDPRERPLEKQQQADEAHARFANETSDFLSYLLLWEFYHGLKEKLSKNQLRKACQQNFLSPTRMWEWVDVHRQLADIVQQEGLRPRDPAAARKPNGKPQTTPSPKADSTAIHRALLTGLLSNVAQLGDPPAEEPRAPNPKPRSKPATSSEYIAAGGGKFFLWPGSGVAARKPKWVMAAELVETSRRYLRCVSRIDPAWIEPLAPHLVQRNHTDPVWSRENSAVMANEKVTLFGLTIVPRRRVRYGNIDPVKSRELFLQHALVEGDFDTPGTFLAENQRLLESLKERQTKTRRFDLLPDDEAVYNFYDQRIPADVFDGTRFEHWRREAERAQPRLLIMTEQDLVAQPAEELSTTDFPENISLQGVEAPLEYRFEPGATDDGVTLSVPREALNQLDSRRLGWLVPGLLEEKITAMIKSLPKDLRRNFVPVPDTARAVLKQLRFGEGDLTVAVADALRRISGEPVPPDQFDLSRLPEHLRMNVRVIDEQGEAVAANRNLQELQRKVGVEAAAHRSDAENARWHRDGITAWDFDTLPDSVELIRGNVLLKAYPAIIDRGESVSVRLVDCPHKAAFLSRAGIRRLFALTVRRDLKSQVDWLPDINRLVLIAATFPSYALPPDFQRPPAIPGEPASAPQKGGKPAANAAAPKANAAPAVTVNPMTDFRQQLADLIADRAFYENPALPQTAHQFQERVKLGRNRISVAVQDVAVILGPILTGYQEARKAVEAIGKTSVASPPKAAARFGVPAVRNDLSVLRAIADDIRLQIALLVEPGFLTLHRWEWLNQYPRYFQGILQRLKKLSGDGIARDRRQAATFEPRWKQFLERLQDHWRRDLFDPALWHYRWMLEEYRVSLFAQTLGTGIAVSDRRLDEQWSKVRA